MSRASGRDDDLPEAAALEMRRIASPAAVYCPIARGQSYAQRGFSHDADNFQNMHPVAVVLVAS
jgi:hypothetical protein